MQSLPPQVKEIYESSLVKTKKEKPESSPKAIIANGKKRKEQVATSNAEDKVKKKKLEKKVEKVAVSLMLYDFWSFRRNFWYFDEMYSCYLRIPIRRMTVAMKKARPPLPAVM